MTDNFKLTKRTVTNTQYNVFIPDPASDEGGGWSYVAQSDGDIVSIESMGSLRVKHLPALITLLECAVKEDTSRSLPSEDRVALSPSFYTYRNFEDEVAEEAEWKNDKAIYATPDGGAIPDDFWMGTGYSFDDEQRSLSVLNLVRVVDRYAALEIGFPTISFHSHELEAVIALLKNFLPDSE